MLGRFSRNFDDVEDMSLGGNTSCIYKAYQVIGMKIADYHLTPPWCTRGSYLGEISASWGNQGTSIWGKSWGGKDTEVFDAMVQFPDWLMYTFRVLFRQGASVFTSNANTRGLAVRIQL